MTERVLLYCLPMHSSSITLANVDFWMFGTNVLPTCFVFNQLSIYNACLQLCLQVISLQMDLNVHN